MGLGGVRGALLMMDSDGHGGHGCLGPNKSRDFFNRRNVDLLNK